MNLGMEDKTLNLKSLLGEITRSIMNLLVLHQSIMQVNYLRSRENRIELILSSITAKVNMTQRVFELHREIKLPLLTPDKEGSRILNRNRFLVH
jgi:hypothetical protein